MDPGTLIGVVLGVGLITTAMRIGGGVPVFVDAESALIVLVGTLSATLVMQRPSVLLAAFRATTQVFFDRARPLEEMIAVITRLVMKARKDGLVALEEEEIEDSFLARGVRLGVDGLSPDVVQAILTAELEAMQVRHRQRHKVFRLMAGTALAMGVMGTLIGLVQVLHAAGDPDSIGPATATALLATLYGAILAYFVLGPIRGKLEHRTRDEVMLRRLTILAVESILKGDNALLVRAKLEAYLPPIVREKMAAENR